MKRNNVRTLRLRKVWSLEKLSEVSGVPLTTLHRIETGQPIDKYRKPLSAALGCPPEELDAPEFDSATVPIVGLITFKSYVKMLPEKYWEPTEHFEGLPGKPHAIRVAASHLKPDFSINTVLYYNGAKPVSDKLFLDRQCLVQIPVKDKRKPSHLLCWVSKGSKPGLYMLTPYSGDIMYDQPILKAYPILYARQG